MTCLTVCLSLCRGVGCIFYEMATGRPLFPGSTVEEELHFIFKLLGENQSASVSSLVPLIFIDTKNVSVYLIYYVYLVYKLCILCAGTPTEQSWPGISSNEEFVTYNYPQYRAERLSNHTPRYTTTHVHNCTHGQT